MTWNRFGDGQGKNLNVTDNYLESYGRVNGLVSLEERQAKKEESKRKWEEEKAASMMRWEWREFG